MTNLDEEPPSPARSSLMSKVRSRNTKPELLVRSALHRLGYRYRLHDHRLPGCPDIVFRSRRLAVFIHGCFWHQHDGCRRSTIPATRRSYWEAKLRRNVERDRHSASQLLEAGWRVVIIWECELKAEQWLELLRSQLGRPRATTPSKIPHEEEEPSSAATGR